MPNPESLNKLSQESSPYLLQHADNPVAWYPWGDEAFARAKSEDKPIFLSIGYSTCHWCHVMAHESFEDPEVADLMNRSFINIKVDREERPDIDSIYMTVCQMLSGSGGWPLSIIMTPDREPFFAATYIPKTARFGRMGLLEMIPQIDQLWRTKRSEVVKSADQIIAALRRVNSAGSAEESNQIDETISAKTFEQLQRSYDTAFGGFGAAPKFPTPHYLLFLLRYGQRTGNKETLQMVENSLRKMRLGGVYDHVGFGFHRYSTDPHWLLPHFEKMLYDQAMLTLAYTECFQLTGDDRYIRTADEIITYVLRDMTSPEGGFYSAEDADSEGKEGKFYLWAEEEINDLLEPDDAGLFKKTFNVKPKGNFREESTGDQTGENIIYLEKSISEIASEYGISEDALSAKLESIRRTLFNYRENRVHPSKDDKILTDWNGLMIAALAKAGRATGNPDYEHAARRAADFLLKTMRKSDGSLMHRYRNADAAIKGNLDDYVFLTWGLIELYQLTFDLNYLKAAIDLTDYSLVHFWDVDHGAFFFTADDSEKLLVRTREIFDAAIPSGNSVATLNLLRLAKMTGKIDYEEKAHRIIQTFADNISQAPSGTTFLMSALEFALGYSHSVVIVGDRDRDDTRSMLDKLRQQWLPNTVVMLKTPDLSDALAEIAPSTADQIMINDLATAYVCTNENCLLPTNSPDQMLKSLQESVNEKII